MDKVSLAIFGATGIIGQEILGLLAEDAQEYGEIQLSASDDSIGEYYDFLGKEIEVLSLEKINFSIPTLSVLCAPKDVCQSLLSEVLEKSMAVIDCTGIDRESNNLKLLPASLNLTNLRKKHQAYYLRTAAGYMLSSFLESSKSAEKIKSVVATCIEPVSGAGRLGLDELWTQIKAIFNQTGCDPEFFPEQIAFNVLSHVDLIRDDGSTAFEQRVATELNAAGVKSPVSITALRAPIMYGAGVSFTIEVPETVTVEDLISNLKEDSKFGFDSNQDLPASTLSVLGDDKIRVCRLRAVRSAGSNMISGWLAADNIRCCLARPVVEAYRSLMPMS